MTASPTTLADRLEGLIRAQGLSIAALAHATGLNRNAIYMLRSGARTNPQVRTLNALAEALGVTVGYLTGAECAPETTK
jgi:transcriptional regulator with XRE-family HTH domain